LSDGLTRRWFPWLLIGLALLAGWLPGSWFHELIPDEFRKAGRDQVLHAAGFMILTVGFRAWGKRGLAASAWLPGAILLLLVFAMLHEGVQALIPGRTHSWEDFRADLIGIAVGSALILLWDRPQKP